jgi:hypothetical protein
MGIGGTMTAQNYRTVEMLAKFMDEKRPLYEILYFLYDAQTDNEQLKDLAEIAIDIINTSDIERSNTEIELVTEKTNQMTAEELSRCAWIGVEVDGYRYSLLETYSGGTYCITNLTQIYRERKTSRAEYIQDLHNDGYSLHKFDTNRELAEWLADENVD